LDDKNDALSGQTILFWHTAMNQEWDWIKIVLENLGTPLGANTSG
jgi:hypothetical protein